MGVRDGIFDGKKVGSAEGRSVGASVGGMVSPKTVGVDVTGALLGLAVVGATEGASVGEGVGAVDGASVGSLLVGAVVGSLVGGTTGALDGDAVAGTRFKVGVICTAVLRFAHPILNPTVPVEGMTIFLPDVDLVPLHEPPVNVPPFTSKRYWLLPAELILTAKVSPGTYASPSVNTVLPRCMLMLFEVLEYAAEPIYVSPTANAFPQSDVSRLG